MTQLIAQWRMTPTGGLPEDVHTNSWAFVDETDAQLDDAAESIAEGLTAFYGAIDQFISGAITGAELRVYDAADPEPRIPVIIELPAFSGSASRTMPEEVALCLSFYSGRNLPRQRGRLFLGPLGGAIVAATGPYNRPSTTLQNAVQTGVEDMWAALGAPVGGGPAGIAQAVWSRTDGVFRPVTNYWVDNAFDTVRSRGGAPDSRLQFLAPVP